MPHIPPMFNDPDPPTSSAADQCGERIHRADRGKGQRFHPGHRIYAVLLAAMVVAAIAIGATAVTLWRNYTRWDPLGVYPPQTVVNRVPGTSTPAVLLTSGEVTVTGTKCNSTDHPVTVTGTKTWVLVEPPGSVIPESARNGGTNPDLLPGCSTHDYRNPIPPQVRDRVIELAEQGRSETIWAITGIETPVDDNGNKGVQRSWSTTNFTIIYDDPTPG